MLATLVQSMFVWNDDLMTFVYMTSNTIQPYWLIWLTYGMKRMVGLGQDTEGSGD